MDMPIFALTTAVSVGLGCGTCCSPMISTFLSTYVVAHAGGVKKGILSFVSFFFGKMASVSLLCMISALISRQFISESGYIGAFNLRLFSQAAMSVTGMVLAVRWFFDLKKQRKCSGCKECGKTVGKSGFVPMLAAGFTYGMTPCAPLLLMIGYSFTLPVSLAGATGAVFSLSSMVSPALLLVVVTGALSKKMGREIPYAVKWFRLASYVLLMVMPFFLTAGYE
ncbi:MAG: hypothetical protein K2M20_04835 [Lachnospiraceae bacterium]|nr:hypothetical protein [Lachnospiraceae bacterium]